MRDQCRQSAGLLRAGHWLGAMLVCLSTALMGCARLGFTDRVLLRVPSPSGSVVAVCQEVPMLDGPGYSVRLEYRDDRPARHLYEIGDGDPCSEIAWSPDGRTLAVLSAHVARVRFVDVAWAEAHPDDAPRSSQVSLAGEGQFLHGRSVAFTDPRQVELEVCPYQLADVQRTGVIACTDPPQVLALNVQTPTR